MIFKPFWLFLALLLLPPGPPLLLLLVVVVVYVDPLCIRTC
jgi:hypothetical protein